MSQKYKVVDLFAGPGGLAEGFAAFATGSGQPFEIALSVEKESSAFKTLRLRSFFRQFKGKAPPLYYDYIAGRARREDLEREFGTEWRAAEEETLQAELGTAEAAEALYPRIERIAQASAGHAVLVGGPPCQAYSLVGRARNRGKSGYVPEDDNRHFLYREYIEILRRLKPAAFIMENVKGFLSAKVDGGKIFGRVMNDLQSATGADSYRVFALGDPQSVGKKGFVLRSEDYGIPQRRHRVILLGLRRDIAERLHHLQPTEFALESLGAESTVSDVLQGMAELRSGLSRKDSLENWHAAVVNAFERAASAAAGEPGLDMRRVADRLAKYARKQKASAKLPQRSSGELHNARNQRLASWLHDPRLIALPNHETRGHMADDLARYAFAATYAEVLGRSPKACDFPVELAPKHKNWKSGKFSDRFRTQLWNQASTTITSHIAKDGHYFIHPDPLQCRSLTVREAARLQTFPDNYFFEGKRTEQYVQVGNAVPPLLAAQIAGKVYMILSQVFAAEKVETDVAA